MDRIVRSRVGLVEFIQAVDDLACDTLRVGHPLATIAAGRSTIEGMNASGG